MSRWIPTTGQGSVRKCDVETKSPVPAPRTRRRMTAQGKEPSMTLTIYPARLVRTMDPARPTAEAVAVAGDRIRAVGSLEELRQYGDATIDDRYADSVLFPGFVEAHAHTMGGALWRHTYVGFHGRLSPDGRRWAGCQSIDDGRGAAAGGRREAGRSAASHCWPGASTRSTSTGSASTDGTSTRSRGSVRSSWCTRASTSARSTPRSSRPTRSPPTARWKGSSRTAPASPRASCSSRSRWVWSAVCRRCWRWASTRTPCAASAPMPATMR